MCLVDLYTYWEDHYRAQVAAALSMEKEAIRVPVFGDVRHIRQSIVHHRGIALPEVEKCQVLKWFQEGDRIAVSTSQFRQLAREVNGYLDGLTTAPSNGATKHL